MSRPTVLGGGEWPPSSKVEIADYEDGRIVLHDVFLASIFLAYVEPKLFFAFARENSPVQPLTMADIVPQPQLL